MDERDYRVYVHTNLINGKRYVGITSQKPQKRWDWGGGYRKNIHFFRSIRKYGWNNFSHEIIQDNLTKDEACAMEIKLIAEYKTTDPQYGYNVAEGGGGVAGYHHTEETKRLLSEKLSGANNPNFGGATISERQRELSIQRNLGKKLSEEHKKKIGDALRGRKHHTEERKRQMSEIYRKKVMRDDGVVFESFSDAALSVGVGPSAISNSIKRKGKSGGHTWTIVDEKPNDYPDRE